MPNKPKMETAICEFCKKEYEGRSTDIKRNRRFCSKKCRFDLVKENKRVDITCHNCNKEFKKLKSRLRSSNNLYFCSKKCQDKSSSCYYQSNYKTGPQIKSGIGSYRVRAFNHFGAKCFVCNYSDLPQLLDVDHRDNDKSNNTVENLRVLCVFCHAMKTRVPEKFIERCKEFDVEYVCKSYCKVCKAECLKTLCGSCKSASSKNRISKNKISWPDDDELLKLAQSMPLRTLGEKLGVSANSIKKRCKVRGIVYLKSSKES